MKAKRWTLGIVLAAAVSLWGLIEADASPFSSSVLTDDLSNQVNSAAPEASTWNDDGAGTDSGASADSGNGNNGHGNNADGVDSSNPGKDNNGHGNNADGVDSSNPGQGNGGPNGATDASCTDPNNCVDDEIKGGSSTSSTDGSAKTNNGKANGKNK